MSKTELCRKHQKTFAAGGFCEECWENSATCSRQVDGLVSLPELSSVEENQTENEEMLAQWVTWLEGSIKLLRKIHPAKYKHCCNEWDGLVIDEYDLEFEACTCFTELRAG